jgi:signal transduction histidine kinase
VNGQDQSVVTNGLKTPVSGAQPVAAEKVGIRFPIRLKILMAVFGLLTVTVAVITASMARVFGDDKIAYVNDVAAMVAGSTATESATLLRGYLHDVDVISAIVADPAVRPAGKELLAGRLFTRLPQFIAVIVGERGVAETTVYDRKTLLELGIEGAELVKQALARMESMPPAAADAVRVGTLVIPGAGSLLLLERPLPELAGQPARVLLACIRLDELANSVERGRGFRTALLDSRGTVLLASGQGSAAAPPAWVAPMFLLATPAQASVMTREFTADDVEFIGARAPVNVAGVIAVTAIPRSAAYLTAQDLLDNLMLVSMALIVVGALVALLISQRLTQPIEQLASAAERIGRGDFAVRMRTRSSDEIGALASVFNSMASGLHERERKLVDAQQALVRSEKMSAFGQLSAGIAHEVKNPLTGILGHAQLAMRRVGTDSPAMPSLDLIAKEAVRCSDIIANLMRFAHQDAPRFKPVNVNDVVEAAMDIVDHQLALQGIRILRQTGAQLPKIEGDFNQLEQVLVNLAINAQQAMAGQRGELSVRTWAGDGQVYIEVRDSGPGIPAELQARIFEPFFTTKTAGQGTGLGLSVSYGIVESHRGRIVVRSEPGQGATFVISLPAAGNQGMIAAEAMPGQRNVA